MRHRGAEFRKLRRVGRPHDRTDGAELAAGRGLGGETFHHLGDGPIHRHAFGLPVLKRARFGVARANEDVNPRPAFPGDLDERFQRVPAEIGIDRQRIGGPHRGVRILAGQIGAGIGFRRGPDVPALGVADHNQPGAAGPANDPLEHAHPRRSQLLKERRLRFDRRHQRGHHIDDAKAKLLERRGFESVLIRGSAFFRGANHRSGQSLETRIQPHQRGGVFAPNGSVQTVGEVDGHVTFQVSS